MIPSVIADGMSSLDNAANDVRPLLHVFSDQEERCLRAMLREHIEQLAGVRIVGPIVIGQRQSPRSLRQSDEAAAIKLRRRQHRMQPRERRRTTRSNGAEESWKHGSILSAENLGR